MTNEEIIRSAQIAILSEITNQCKCEHKNECSLNNYMWQKYSELFPEGEISEESSVLNR
jgi:hypothetical protein